MFTFKCLAIYTVVNQNQIICQSDGTKHIPLCITRTMPFLFKSDMLYDTMCPRSLEESLFIYIMNAVVLRPICLAISV